MNKPIIHKEFLQDAVNADVLFDEYKNMDRNLFFQNSKLLRDYLQNGSSKNVANIIQK